MSEVEEKNETNFNEVIECLPIMEEGQVQFNTAILTYPSDFNGFLSVGIICEFLYEKLGDKVKMVVAREDADEKIQRNHFHCYIDSPKRLRIYPRKYFDIKLPNKLVVLIKQDKTREYEDYNELESKLGWDNYEEMVGKLSSYIFEKGYVEYEVLEYAHPNLQIKQRYGSKYQMLRYVIKQNLVARSTFEVNEEMKWLEENENDLRKKCSESIKTGKFVDRNINIMDEMMVLIKDLQRKTKRLLKKSNVSAKEEEDFQEWLRVSILENKLDQSEVFKEILNNNQYWKVFLKNGLVYKSMIQDLMKTRVIKPTHDYWKNNLFYLPRKLYDYVMWLDDWVRRWNEGQIMEERPKGLVVISPSRYGKTELFIALGSFTYECNIWNMDQWDNSAAFNIFDDMDPGSDPAKGLNFVWYKGLFGAQKMVGLTDKYRRKRMVRNGKPMIWLTNFELNYSFKNEEEVDYIEKNCYVIRLSKPLYEPAPDWIEGHNDYVTYDTRTTWWYKNKIEEEEPLIERKRRLSVETNESRAKFEEEKGRPLSLNKN